MTQCIATLGTVILHIYVVWPNDKRGIFDKTNQVLLHFEIKLFVFIPLSHLAFLSDLPCVVLLLMVICGLQVIHFLLNINFSSNNVDVFSEIFSSNFGVIQEHV